MLNGLDESASSIAFEVAFVVHIEIYFGVRFELQSCNSPCVRTACSGVKPTLGRPRLTNIIYDKYRLVTLTELNKFEPIGEKSEEAN